MLPSEMIENTQLMLNPINQYFGKLTNDIFNVNLNVWKQPFFLPSEVCYARDDAFKNFWIIYLVYPNRQTPGDEAWEYRISYNFQSRDNSGVSNSKPIHSSIIEGKCFRGPTIKLKIGLWATLSRPKSGDVAQSAN